MVQRGFESTGKIAGVEEKHGKRKWDMDDVWCRLGRSGMHIFRQRKNKTGEAYGWPIAIYSTPEHIWGREHVTSTYTESATESGEQIAKHMMEICPIATAQQIRRVIGNIVGETSEYSKKWIQRIEQERGKK